MSWGDICKKDQAWNKAREALIDGTCTLQGRALNCLKYGTPGNLSPECLSQLLEAYG